MGRSIVKDFHCKVVTHLIIDKPKDEKLKYCKEAKDRNVKQFRNKKNYSAHNSWVYNCVLEKKLLLEKNYEILDEEDQVVENSIELDLNNTTTEYTKQ